MKMRGRLNRTMSVTEPNSVHTNGLSNTLPKNISKQGTYNTTKDNVSGNVRMFQHDNLPQETYFHHNLSSGNPGMGEDGLHHNNNKANKSGTTEEVGTMTRGGSGGPSSKLGSIAMSSSTLPMSLSSIQQNVRTLPLPKLGLSSPWFNAGIKFCGNRRISHIFNLLWGLVYSMCGSTQFVAGIYFMLDLPIFQLGSNIWTGAWNLFSGILIILLCSTGQLSNLKAQGILLLSLVVTVVNLVNLVILEVGEWRGFLSQTDKDFIEENGFEHHMYTAYLCTTVSTVLAMITSFLASQHTFCYLQLQAEKAKAVKNMNFDEADTDTILAKDLVKRQDDGLNLKTPANGPQPHPSWVYRHNYAQFNPQQQHQLPNAGGNYVSRRDSISGVNNTTAIVKRSLSLLNRQRATKSEGRNIVVAANNNNNTGNHHQATNDRLELLSKQLNGSGGNTTRGGIATVSEAVDNSAGGNGMRHAVIRRHQSMYIHPRATENLIPAAFASSQPYKLHEVSGNSEIRPIVTLKRSHTTVGQMSSNMHYTHSSTLQKNQQQKTFRAASKLQALRQQHLQSQRDLPNQAHASRYLDHNQNNAMSYDSRKRRRKSLSPSAYYTHQQQQQQHHHHSGTLTHHRERGMTVDDICEFQAGPSFDLPDPERFRRVNATGWGLDNGTSKLGCVIFDSDGHSNTMKRTGIRHPHDEMSTDSCGENIRYQAVEGLVHHDNRPKRQMSFLKQQNHYSSLENLLIDEKSAAENILNLANGGGLNTVTDLRTNNGSNLNGLVRYNSTGSIDSLGSAAVPVHQTFSANIQQQYQQYNGSTLHHNNNNNNNNSNMGSSNTLSRFSKNQTPTSLYSQDNDSSRNFSSTSGLDISQESQVIEMEMDMIMELHNQRKTKQRKHHQGILNNRINEADIYDGTTSLSKRGPVTVRKSNSRVSSTGKLRLRVESFRNTQTTTNNGDNNIIKNQSSGTQTDISVLKQRGQDRSSPKIGQEITPIHHTEIQNHSQGKYTGQYKKHTAPPNKPARKSKPSPNGNNNTQRRPSNTSDNGSSNGGIGSNGSAATSENRSDRSTSPDNSSTSGYSSPSAGIHSKESSPCGSKIPSPPQSMEESEGNITLEEPLSILNKEDCNEEEHNESVNLENEKSNEHDEYQETHTEQNEEEEKSKITVIQIVPTTAGGRETNTSEQEMDEHRYRQHNYQPPTSTESSYNTEDLSKEVPPSIPPQKLFHYHRELPRIATNGTLSRQQQQQQQHQQQQHQQQQSSYQPHYQQKRKLPDRTTLPPPPPEPLNNLRTTNNHSQSGIGMSSGSMAHPSSNNPGSSNNSNKPLPSSLSSTANSTSNSNAPINNGQRLFRSNLPRPAPIHNYGHQGGRSVPLPPVPELDRSDHERESMSPVPESLQQQLSVLKAPSTNLQNNNHLHYNQSNGNSNRYQPQHLSKLRPLPSPLTTPIQPAERIIQPRPRRFGGTSGGERHAELPQIPTQQISSISRIPRATAASSALQQTIRDTDHEISENRTNNSGLTTSYSSPSFKDRASVSKSRESSKSPESYQRGKQTFLPQQQQINSNNENKPRETTYKTTLEHQPRRNSGGGNGGNKSSSINGASDESQVEERLRALIAMLGKTQKPTNNNIIKEKGIQEDHNRNNIDDTMTDNTTSEAPNRGGMGLGLGNLEPLIGGNLPQDEQGTLQYLSQLETVARRLKDQLLQDQQKSTTAPSNAYGSRSTPDFDRAEVKESEC